MNRLHADSSELACECRRHKARLGERWTEPMGDVQRALARARRRLTELHVLRASLRGRLHVVRAPRGAPGTWTAEEHGRQIAERVAKDYAVVPVESPPEARTA